MLSVVSAGDGEAREALIGAQSVGERRRVSSGGCGRERNGRRLTAKALGSRAAGAIAASSPAVRDKGEGVREQRVRAQVAAGRRESAAFLENVEKAKRVAHGMKKREKQGIAKEGEAADTSTKKDAGTFGAHKRRIRQHQPMQEALDDRKAPSSTLLGAVLGAGEGRKRKRSSSRDSGNERNKK